MTSTTLLNRQFFNMLKIQVKQLRLWMIIVPLIISCATVYGVIVFSTSANSANSATTSYGETVSINSNADDTRNIYSDDSSGRVAQMTVVLSSIILMVMTQITYSHLYSKRHSDLFDALPVTKKQIMLSRTFCVGIILTVSLILQIIITYIMIHSDSYNTEKSVPVDYYVKTYIIGAICSFAFYCIAQLCAVAAGRGWQYWSLVCGTGIAIPFGISFLLYMPSGFMAGASRVITVFSGLLSPLIAPSLVITHDIRFRYIILAMVAISIIFLLLTMYVYKKRKSENAEQSVSGYIAVGLSVFGIQTIMYGFIFLTSFKVSQTAVVIAVGIALSVVAMLILSAMYYRKAIAKPIAIQVSLVCVCISVYIAVLAFGSTGFVNYQPVTADVNQVKVYIEGWNDRSLVAKTNFDSYIDNELPNGGFYKDKDTIDVVKNIQSKCIADFSDMPVHRGSLSIKMVYYLNNGKKVYRYYPYDAKYAPYLYETNEYKENSDIVKCGKDNIVAISYGGMSDGVDKNRYYDAIISDYVSMKHNEFKNIISDDSLGLSNITFYFYYIKDGASESERKKLMSMNYEEVEAYFNKYSVNAPSKCFVGFNSVVLTSDAKAVCKLLINDKLGVKTTEYKDIDVENISHMECTSIKYSKLEKSYQIGPESNYCATDNLNCIIGKQVIINEFEENNSYVFQRVNTKDDIKKTFESVEPKDQIKQLKDSSNKGYIVYFVMKDGSRSRTFFVSDVSAYDDDFLD